VDGLDANVELLYIFYNDKSGVKVIFINVEFNNLHIDIGISVESFNNGECS
jgi:hypothetical protein